MHSDSICLMPWIHLYIDTNGNAKACCNSSITYGNVNNESLASIWENESIKTFRKNLLKGIKDKRCSACFKRELANKSSIRTETLEKYASYLKWVEKTTENGTCRDAKPIYLDIRYSNICNLKCRTCWHGASSSWFNDAKILKTNFGDKAIIQATTDSAKLIGELFSFGADFEEIYFAGGEPLMMDEHYDFLDTLLLKNQKNVHLRYNTNLSILSLKKRNAIDYWKQFPNIAISVSIDAIEEKAAYIRSGLNWNNLLSNFTEIKEKCPHIRLEIAPAVSILSILTLGKLHRYFVENNYIQINNIYLNILDRPHYYNCTIASQKLKEKIQESLDKHIEWLISQKANTQIITEFQSVIDYLNNGYNTNHLRTFHKQTKLLDKLRNETFKTIFPELFLDLNEPVSRNFQ